jgi:hypothetical protein
MPDNAMCQMLLAQKNSLSAQLDQFNQTLALQWAVCVADDVFPGGPASGQDQNSVQLRIDELVHLASDPSDPFHGVVIDAINAYNAYLSTLMMRMQVQLQLNTVIQQLIANGCPLE